MSTHTTVMLILTRIEAWLQAICIYIQADTVTHHAS